MPLDGLFLGCIARELEQKLAGGRVDRVVQPEADEINIMIRNNQQNYRLLLSASPSNARIHITQHSQPNPMQPPMFCMLLRKHLTGGRITGINQINGDRILDIKILSLDDMGEYATNTLTIEIMGRHSNIILHSGDGRIIDAVHHVGFDISRVRLIQPGQPYERPPEQDKINLFSCTKNALIEILRHGGRLDKLIANNITGVSPSTARELAFRVTGMHDADIAPEQAESIAQKLLDFSAELPQLCRPVIIYENDIPADVCPFFQQSRGQYIQKEFSDCSAALEEYYISRSRGEHLRQKSHSLHRSLRNHIQRNEKKRAIQLQTMQDSADMDKYRLLGELLTANLSRVKKRQEQISVINYYSPEGGEITIPLDNKLSPSDNAQRYFKLYQKAKNAKKYAVELLKGIDQELNLLEGWLDDLRKCEDESELNELRDEIITAGFLRASHNRKTAKKLPPSTPHKFTAQDGTEIFVGKNNAQNDRLTFSSNPEYTWLHAKDMPGSHVVIASDKEISDETLRAAANLAALYSKGRHSSNVPIDFTKCRYVKKPGGARPGFVTYTRQRTVFITPDEGMISSMRA